MKYDSVIHIRCDKKLHKEIKEYCTKKRMPLSALIRLYIERLVVNEKLDR